MVPHDDFTFTIRLFFGVCDDIYLYRLWHAVFAQCGGWGSRSRILVSQLFLKQCGLFVLGRYDQI